MGTWIGIGLFVLIGPKLLTWWVNRQARVQLLSLPLYPMAYVETDAASVPASLRDGFATVSAELTPLGFEAAGFISSPLFPGLPPRVLAVLRHPARRTFASVAFALSERRGATVDFETLFEDATWLRTVNRRAHFSRARFRTGRELDAYAATIAEQWSAHERALDEGQARVARDADVAALARHRNDVDREERELGLEDGSRRVAEDGVSLRATPAGAERLMVRAQEGARRIAPLPPPRGAFTMPIPADEQERKYQDLSHIVAQRPKPRRGLAFLLSVAAFAASAALLPHWRWLLWVIPFLLLHELGHFAAMRLFGHRDARIRFIPFLGAATMTTTQFRKLSHEMVVLLAGPLPGILLGLALFQLADVARGGQIVGVAITLVVLNGLNLLPLHPLDGGRILHALVTAGRPRLDLALKALAGAAFVVGAIVYKDVTLVILGGFGVLLLRSDARQSRTENAIRARPDFSPALPPAERRRLIFEAEAAQGGGDTWVQSVRQLEVRLGHAPPRLRTTLPWLALYAGCLGGLAAWGLSIFALTPKLVVGCPKRAHARPVACGADAAAVDWAHPEPGSMTRNPFKLVSLASRSEYPFAAFVWCAGAREVTGKLETSFSEVAAADGFCPALPWEPLPAEATPERENARWTFRRVSGGGHRMTREQRLRRVDNVPADLLGQKRFDAETLRLYRASLTEESEGEAHRRLAARLGRSTTESCKRLRIVSVGNEREPTVERAVRKEGEGDDHRDDDDDSPEVVFIPRLSVLLASPADLEPLRRYLCEAGCEVDVLPYGAMDPRLRRCF